MMCLQVSFFFTGFRTLSVRSMSPSSHQTPLRDISPFVILRLDLTVNFVSVEEIEESFYLSTWAVGHSKVLSSGS